MILSYLCGVLGRNKINVDNDNLGGSDGRLQINKNWIWRKNDGVELN